MNLPPIRRSHQFLLMAALASSISMAEDWPRWRGPDLNGISRETGWSTDWPDEGPAKLWTAKVGIGLSSMSVAGGRLFTMGNVNDVDHVYALDEKTGQELWTHKYPCKAKDPNGYHGTRCTPTVDSDRVYTVSREGHLFCLNARDGKVIWSKHFQNDFGAKVPTWGFSGSPLVEGNLLIVEAGADGAAVVAFNKNTGEVVWKAGKDGAGYASPVAYSLDGERAVAVFSASGPVAYRIKDGQELWRQEWKTSYDVNAATIIVEGDKAFISSGYNRGCALIQFKDNKPKILWENKNMRNHMNPSILWKGHLYGIDENELRCLEWETGKSKWSTGDFGKGSVTMAGGLLIVYGQRGQLGLVEANPEKYVQKELVQVLGGRDTWAVPVLANGRIFARSAENLVALDVGAKSKVAASGNNEGFKPLFPKDGEPQGWVVRAWHDVKEPGPANAVWHVKDGVLHGSEPRGTWLVSEKEYSDFTLKFEFKLGERGNSGCGLRFPGQGDPAFDGLELQMVDPRYYGDEAPNIPQSELTGSLYRAVAPKEQRLKPQDWNNYEVTLKGSHVLVQLNGAEVLNYNLDDHKTTVKRHNGQDATPLKDRPRKGRIGFQELSRGGAHVEIRNAMIKEL